MYISEYLLNYLYRKHCFPSVCVVSFSFLTATRAESYKNITRFNSFVHKTELFAKLTSETAPSLFVKQSRLTKQTLLDGSCSQWIQNDPGSYLACTCRQGVVLILLRASITRRLNCYQSMPYLTQFGPRLQSHLCCLQCNLCYQLIELKDSVHLERSNTVPGNSSLSRRKIIKERRTMTYRVLVSKPMTNTSRNHGQLKDIDHHTLGKYYQINNFASRFFFAEKQTNEYAVSAQCNCYNTISDF